MSAVNTYHTLNEYRLSTESVYENGSHSKLGAAALVVALFLGVGAYFFYPLQQRSTTAPASSNMNYRAPAAIESATPADTMDSVPLLDAPNAIAASPTIPSTNTSTTPTSAQDPVTNRSVIETKPRISPAQPAPRAKQPAKPLSQSTVEPAPRSTGDATVEPEMTTPAPIATPQPATVEEPLAIEPETPTDVDPDAAAP